MSAPDKTKQEIQLDPTEVLAQKLYIELCGRVYSVSGSEKPQPKMLAQMSFKLAEVFQAANYEFNPTAIAAREARAKASVNLDNVQIDFGAGKPK
jgi:ABC-type Fe2+-enterobactin transport system substrate-binding protein